ncbi:threonine aldolase family protein [Hyphobacterium sp.]|uniref:threonine aldolase family protein n=1 Tax=Hyphobacterium sp. TaxID=2004662 RepID=UPI003B51D24B
MNFLSDTTAPVHPAVLAALADANDGYAPSYGADPLTHRLKDLLQELFEAEIELVLTTSGTASNALALSVMCPSHGMILCHDEAHIHRDERGAPEFFTGGGKLLPLTGDHAKIDPARLRAALEEWPQDFVHTTPPRAVSISNLNESGCAYDAEALRALTVPAREKGLGIHFDGARFANALVSLKARPAELSWKAGCDVLCLGATKNGAIGAEAIVLFGDLRERLGELQARQKRSGHMGPKIRFIAAQMLAWLTDDLWLDLARQANAAAAEIARLLTVSGGAELVHPVDGNEVFVRLDPALERQLKAGGAGFYGWPDGSARFVASWSTSEAELAALAHAINR